MSIVPRAKTAVANFLPTSIGGCQLWLDAADSSTITYGTGSNVASWKDKINNYAVANSTAAYQPVYSQGSIQFNGITSPSYLDIPTLTIGSSAFSIFIVIKNTGPASGNASAPHFFWPLSGNGSGALSINGWIVTNIQGLNTNISYALSKNQYYVLSYTFGVTSNFEELYANGTSIGTYQKGSAYVASLYRLGTIDSGQTTLSFDGNIGEILVFNTALGITNRQNVEGYLAQKWGLTSQLPAGHPGLTQTFYGTGNSTVSVPIRLIPYNIYTNYNPLTATGSTCILWLDASDPSTLFSDVAGTTLASASGTVGYWRDKSSSGFNCTQTTLAYRPTYLAAAKNGRSILSFNGLTNFLNMPQFTAVPLTIFFVGQGTVFIPNTFFLSLGTAGNTVMMRMLYSQQVYGVDGSFAGSIAAIATTNADTNWHLWTLTISSSTVTLYFDGILVGTSSWTNGSSYTFATNTIASWNQQVGSQATTINMPEILFYSAVFATPQQQQVEAYLTEKWAIKTPVTRSVASIRTLAKYIQFSPRSIAGCQLWLDAADATTITQSGGTVSQWTDKSSNAFVFTQATSSYQPTFISNGTNGLSLLRFNGTNQYLGGGTTLTIGTNDVAMFAVCKYTVGSIVESYIFAKSLYGGAAGRILFGLRTMGIADAGFNVWWQGTSYESSYASYHSVEFVTTRASGVNTFYANGSQFYQINPGVDTSTNWTSGYNMIVGGYNNSSGGINPPQTGLYMNGDICEILLFSSTIDNTQRQQIEGYLAQKWGLTSQLPAGHPGLTTRFY